MGIDVNIYTKGFSVDLIPEIKKRFSDFQMYIEFHPEFKFDEQTDTGFLPIKLKVYPEHSKHYDNIDYEILTGFELFFSDYDFEEELKNIQPEAVQSENRSFLSRLFGSNNAALPTTISFVANEQLDKLL
jgi:hypothetical protein